MVKMAALLSLFISLAGGAMSGEAPAPEGPYAEDETDFVRLGSPKPGEWRYVFQEPVQTFEDHRGRTGGGRLRREHFFIGLVPFRGETPMLDEESLRLLREFLGAYFMMSVYLGPTRGLPDALRRRPSRGFGSQVLADDVLREMSEMSRDELGRIPWGVVQSDRVPFTGARLGIVQTDLYGSSPGGGYLNFVFGMGAYGRGVAVISPARYSLHYEGEPEGITLRKRVFKVAAHEIGHVFNLAHCRTYACCMNGSNSLPESDRRPVHLCPECLRKLEWRFGFDRWERYRALARICRGLGWHKEGDFAARRAVLDPGLLVPGVADPRGQGSKGTE